MRINLEGTNTYFVLIHSKYGFHVGEGLCECKACDEN